jgi:putative tryptophan/tyrosine transport system substrate-binding protein
MKKKIAVLTLCAVLLTLCASAEAQQAKKVFRIGWLASGFSSAKQPRYEAFRQGLRDLGYIEGQNIVIERRFAEGKLDLLPELATELVRFKVDVIVTGGVPQLLAAKHATATVPVVAGGAGDLVAVGIVASLARPGGNITGLTSVSTDLAGKWLEILKETIPKLSRVGVLWNPADIGSNAVFKETEVAAPKLGLKVQSVEVRNAQDIDNGFKEPKRNRANAFIILQSDFTNRHLTRIVEIATKRRLPTMLGESGLMDSGGLMSYGPNYADMYRRAALYVDKILKGTKPADLPVEQPRKFEFVVNLKTAKQIGLTIPPNVLARADKVIR